MQKYKHMNAVGGIGLVNCYWTGLTKALAMCHNLMNDFIPYIYCT